VGGGGARAMGVCEWIREGRGAVEIMKREEK
jgi:hypothetical protein